MGKRIAGLLPVLCLLSACRLLMSTPPHFPPEDGSAPDIRVIQGPLDIPPGGSLEMGHTVAKVPKEVSFTIENRGWAALYLYGNPPLAIGGADASSFMMSSPPSTTIGPGGRSTVKLRFSPSNSGRKTATACITSSDPDTGLYMVVLTGLGTPEAPAPPYEQLSDPANWLILQQYLSECAGLGSSGAPTAAVGSIPLPSGGYKWVGGVLAPNGKIYCPPRSADSVLIIDPQTDTADISSITGLAGSNRWSAGVLAPNQKVYGIPFNSTSVLIIDPAANTADTSTITGLFGAACFTAATIVSPTFA